MGGADRNPRQLQQFVRPFHFSLSDCLESIHGCLSFIRKLSNWFGSLTRSEYGGASFSYNHPLNILLPSISNKPTPVRFCSFQSHRKIILSSTIRPTIFPAHFPSSIYSPNTSRPCWSSLRQPRLLFHTPFMKAQSSLSIGSRPRSFSHHSIIRSSTDASISYVSKSL